MTPRQRPPAVDFGRDMVIALSSHPQPEPVALTIAALSNMVTAGLRISRIVAVGDNVQKVQYRLDFSPWPLSGRLDVLLIPKWKRVVEVKSVPYAMLPYLPKVDHIAQLKRYLHGIRQRFEYAGFDGTLLYAVKDARKRQPVCRPYEMPYSSKNALVTLNAYVKARQDATGSMVPPRPKRFTVSTYPCASCVFQTYCWSGKDSINISPEPDGAPEILRGF